LNPALKGWAIFKAYFKPIIPSGGGGKGWTDEKSGLAAGVGRFGAFPLNRPAATFSPTGEKAGMRGPITVAGFLRVKPILKGLKPSA